MNKQTLILAVGLATAATILTACGGGGGTTTTPGPGTGGATTYTAVCIDGTTRTSTISLADAQSKCPIDTLVTSVPPAVYSGTFAVEKKEVFDQLNADRFACGFGKVAQNTKLDIAAQGHADYLMLNHASGHIQTVGSPGFTGITLADRLVAAGYGYSGGGEVIGSSLWGTFFTNAGGAIPYGTSPLSARNTLRGLYATIYHLALLMDGNLEMGVGVSITNNSSAIDTSFSKDLVADFGIPVGRISQQIAANALVTFPCNGITNLNPYFSLETPDPFPGVAQNLTPYGHPVYLYSSPGTTLILTSGTITLAGGSAVPTVQRNRTNDPHASLTANQVFLVPTQALASNATYNVALQGTNTGMITAANPIGAWTRNFSFQTGTFNTN